MRALCQLVFVLFLLIMSGCASSTDSTATAESTAAAEPTVEATPEPTARVEPSSPPAPTVTTEPTATATPEPTATATPEPTGTAEPTATATPEPTTTPDPPAATAANPTAETATELDENGERDDLPPSDYMGDILAVRTQVGAVVPVRGIEAGGYVVVTPCYNLATISEGLPITGPLDILIDPGHGGDEPGAVGPNGLKESTVNLQVSELLRSELIARGYSTEMTRYADVRVTIQARAELANALNPTVFMSVHHNGGFPAPFPVAATEVFVQLGDPESARLGGLVFQELQRAFADIEADWMGNLDTFGVSWRQNDRGTDLYGVLRRTPSLVSVLTEAMFITTEAEAELLTQPEILQAEAVALADALDRWFDTQDPGTGFIDGLIFEGDLGNGGGTEGCVDPDL